MSIFYVGTGTICSTNAYAVLYRYMYVTHESWNCKNELLRHQKHMWRCYIHVHVQLYHVPHVHTCTTWYRYSSIFCYMSCVQVYMNVTCVHVRVHVRVHVVGMHTKEVVQKCPIWGHHTQIHDLTALNAGIRWEKNIYFCTHLYHRDHTDRLFPAIYVCAKINEY